MTKKTFERILVSENKDDADKYISDEKRNAAEINKELSFFNSLPNLQRLSSMEEIENIMRNTKKALDENILVSFKDSFKSDLKPNPEQLAKLFDVPYDEIITRLSKLSVKGTSSFEEENGLLIISKDSEEKIRDGFRGYLETEEEANAFEVHQNLANSINEYNKKFKVRELSIIENQDIAKKFDFIRKTDRESGRIVFTANLNLIKKMLRNNGRDKSHETYREIFKTK